MPGAEFPRLRCLGKEPGNRRFGQRRRELEQDASARLRSRESGDEPEDQGELEGFGVGFAPSGLRRAAASLVLSSRFASRGARLLPP